MRTTALALAFMALASGTLGAQARNGQARGQGIRRDRCRRPARAASGTTTSRRDASRGPINCRDAERIAARDRNARVVYGSRTEAPRTTGGGWWGATRTAAGAD